MSLTESSVYQNIVNEATFPLVHVLLPVFNQKRFLKSSIDSVLQQDYQNIRLLILNDGSTEDLNDILNVYIGNPQIQLFEQQNMGLPAALNNLYQLSLSREERPHFVTWHSADNIYEKNAISLMVEYLMLHQEFSLVYANVALIDDAGKRLKHSKYRKNDQCLNDSSILDLQYKFDSIHSYNDNFINACFLSRSEAESCLADFRADDRGFEDYIRWLQLSLIGRGAHIGIKTPLYRYRIHDESLTTELRNDDLSHKQLAAVQRTGYIQEALKRQTIPFELSLVTNGNLFSRKITTPTVRTLLNVLTDQIDYHELLLRPILSNSLKEALRVKRSEVGCTLKFSTTDSPSHLSHKRLFDVMPFRVQKKDDPLSTPFQFAGLLNIPSVLTRSRNRELGMFPRELPNYRFLIFCPADSGGPIIEIVASLVSKYKQHLFVLYCANSAERISADNIFLASKCADNIRIVDERECKEVNQVITTGLLNALGSVDCMVSLSCFQDQSECLLRPLTTDLLAETIIACLSLKPLLVNPFYLKRKGSFLIPLPVHVEWESTFDLPRSFFLSSAKEVEVICDSFLDQKTSPRVFGQLIAATLVSLV